MFKPDDFSNRPYDGANNQAMHVVFGAALCGALSAWFAVGVILAWELHQLIKRGAKLSDFRADLFYWLSGVAGWAWLDPAGILALAPVAPLVFWVVEYTRIKVIS